MVAGATAIRFAHCISSPLPLKLHLWLAFAESHLSNLRPSGNTNSFFCLFHKLYNVRKALFHRHFTDIMFNCFFCIVLYFLPFLYVWLTFDWYLTELHFCTAKKPDIHQTFSFPCSQYQNNVIIWIIIYCLFLICHLEW